MRYPILKELESSRQTVDVFRGYNHGLRIADGEFFNMENMTSDDYPVLSPRKKRGVYETPKDPQGMIAKDSLCYVDGADFVIGQTRVELGLSTDPDYCPKQLVSMGAYVIILPDKVYINTMNTADSGSIEADFTTTEDVVFEPCTRDGSPYANTTVSATEPEDPENLDIWIDTSTDPHTLKQYSEASGMWSALATTYVKITSAGIGEKFRQYDGVTITGIKVSGLETLNATMPIWACAEDYIVVTGLADRVTTQPFSDGTVSVKRQMPDMDFTVESGNRLWGCRYGLAEDGSTVNEIYASKLGDFKNWSCFMGLSTDSYRASCGTDGPFTAAYTMDGPHFWKETCFHRVYGNYPANFQIQTVSCRGVQKGSHKSMAVVGDTLYYKSPAAICAYDGSLPVEVSQALGQEKYKTAAGGAVGNKYYVSMADSAGSWHLFVYDTEKGLWHREDSLRADAFCAYSGELYCIDHDTNRILTMHGSGSEAESKVMWMVESGPIGITLPDMKYISRLTIRMSMQIGARMKIYAQYDHSDEWEELCTLTGTSLRSFSIPIRPRRCDFMRLGIEGEGMAKLYSMTKTVEQGSELS